MEKAVTDPEPVAAVQVSHLSKNYPLTSSQLGRLRHLFGPDRQHPKGGLWALRDVAFSVEKGEAFGIVGANGSGKSTLLQIVAGILQPTSGTIEVNGRMSALLELGAGFSPEFTGRDNVYLNASLLGMSREEIDDRFPAIEHFAGIGDFMGQPIRIWSTGMVLRLAFAVAAHFDPEVLIVDEALAVGDIAFHQRCMRRIHELRARGTTILFVSHATSDVKALCERCLWLRNGVVQELGEADQVIAKYQSAALRSEAIHTGASGEAATQSRPVENEDDAAAPAEGSDPARAPALITGFEEAFPGYRYGDGRAKITGVDLISSARQSIRTVGPLDHLVLRVHFQVKAEIASPIVGFLVRNSRGENIFGSNTARENYPMPAMAAGDEHNVDFHWAVPGLAPGDYRISPAIADGNIEEFRMCDYVEDAIDLKAVGEDAGRGYFRLHCAGVSIYRN